MPITEVYNMDCLEGMREYPDNYFQLAIVDPPYGIKHSTIAGKQSGTKYGKSAAAKGKYSVKDWDEKTPSLEYFNELFRVSSHQIIWGANYMTKHLPSSMGWVFWDKNNGTNGFSDGELAYTSFTKGLRKIEITWNGMIQHDMKNKEERIHPTQKPVKLYEWLLMNYANTGDKILDTHLGSGSSRIAAHKLGYDFVGFELDKEYFDAQEERFKNVTAQQVLFK